MREGLRLGSGLGSGLGLGVGLEAGAGAGVGVGGWGSSYLRLEEAGDAVVLVLRYRRQDLRRRLEVAPG